MLVYCIILFIVVKFMQMAIKTKVRTTERRLFLSIPCASMVLVAGLCDRMVGSGTKNYVMYFDDIRTLANVKVIGSKMGEVEKILLHLKRHHK
jgi:ABC-type transporter Mla subunit MlaD